MADIPAAPPVLSTPDDHILDLPATTTTTTTSSLPDDALRTTYEIARTVTELRLGGYTRVALQFPDHMLRDAPRVSQFLTAEVSVSTDGTDSRPIRVYVLADTSYSACCVDEVAAEHADADVVVHYGRTCLSPTSRVPAIFVYTHHELDHEAVVAQFEGEFTDKEEARVVVMADLTYQSHVEELTERIRNKGYKHVTSTEVVRDPAAVIPNRKIADTTLDEDTLKSYAVFHVSTPPTSLLLALQSRFSSLHVLTTGADTSASPSTSTSIASAPTLTNPTLTTTALLRRRFARVLTLSSAGVIGILVNTLSVSNYLSSIAALRQKIAAAGKKSYTVVVGKLNPAKLANFAEVEGWVVVGCWESGLIEDDDGYWRPVVTPFEMEVALLKEEERTWGGEWWGGIEKLSLEPSPANQQPSRPEAQHDEHPPPEPTDYDVSGDESQPPEFDLRTGKLVSHSRPMHAHIPHRLRPAADDTARPDSATQGSEPTPGSAASLVRRGPNQVASINGIASPGAEYLRSQRTWQGLGSDFAETPEGSTVVEEGRSGIARGYAVGSEREGQGGS